MLRRNPFETAALPAAFHVAGLAACLGTALVLYGCVWSPLRAARRDDQRGIQAGREFIGSAARLEAERGQLRREASSRRRRMASLRDRVPTTASEADMLALVNKAARQHGVRIVDYSPGSESRRGTVSRMPLQLTCQGPFPELCRFFDRLGKLPRACRISALSVEAGDGPQHSAELTLDVFFNLSEAEESPDEL